MARIAIIEDDESIRSALSEMLQKNGHEPVVITSFDRVVDATLEASPDLVLLDLNLPSLDGTVVCREIRSRSSVPIIVVTSRTGEIDEVMCMTLGADDFIAKPFDPRELVARVRSVLRRSAITEGLSRAEAKRPEATPTRNAASYMFDGWVFDARGRRLRNPAEEEVALSTVEFHLLRVMLQNPNQVLSRNRLLDLTRGEGADPVFDRSIDSQVSRLRKKLQSEAGGSGFIRTARGDGYLFSADVQARP